MGPVAKEYLLGGAAEYEAEAKSLAEKANEATKRACELWVRHKEAEAKAVALRTAADAVA